MTGETLAHPIEPPMLNRPLVMLMLSAFGALSGFYLLLSVVPLYLAESGGGDVGAGLVTGVMMLGTVLIELVVPRLLTWLGHRVVMSLGLLLLGAPALGLLATSETPLVLGVGLLRGAGLGIVVVVGSALVPTLVVPRRRAEGLAVYGVVVGVPAVVALPAGIWLSGHAGFAPVFVAAAAVALLPLATVPALPVRPGEAVRQGPATHSVFGALRLSGLARPAVVFTAVTFAAGVFATFLPLAVPSGARGVAAVALGVQSLTMSAGRLAAGRFGDRHGSGKLLVPSVLTATAGAALLLWPGSPFATITGMALFGLGFGAAQNVTLALMMERVDPAEYGRTSALWNLAYDGGVGLGAIGFGLVAGPAGYVTGFALTAAILAAALAPAALDRRAR